MSECSELPDKSGVVDVVIDSVERVRIVVRYDEKSRDHCITDPDGAVISSVLAFWFAWRAFYADTEIWNR